MNIGYISWRDGINHNCQRNQHLFGDQSPIADTPQNAVLSSTSPRTPKGLVCGSCLCLVFPFSGRCLHFSTASWLGPLRIPPAFSLNVSPKFTQFWLINYVGLLNTSSTAQGGGGSFKNRKPIGEIGCCESGMAERSHWCTERCLISLTLSLSFSGYLPTYPSIFYVSIYLSIFLV